MIVRRLHTFVRLPRAERALLVESALLFHGFRLALRVVPFRVFRPLLGTAVEHAPADASEPPSAATAVQRGLRWASQRYPNTCLVQALAGRVMLRRRGLPSSLSFGVREADGALQFHAWLSCAGRPVSGGRESRHFTLLAAFADASPGRSNPQAGG